MRKSDSENSNCLSIGDRSVSYTHLILRDQGVNIAINLFCGPTVNAARGMAVQVNHAINSFAQNFMTALNPQITKSFAVGDSKYMFTLIFQGARLSFYMLLFLSLPVLMSTEYILSIWLKIVPDYTIISVSYTHLDVYKRQLMMWSLVHGPICLRMILFSMRTYLIA